MNRYLKALLFILLTSLLALPAAAGAETASGSGTIGMLGTTQTVNYMEADGQTRTHDNCIVLKPDNTEWKDGQWLVVTRTKLEMQGRVTITGHVNLILADNAKLIVEKGITVNQGAKLTIWGQSSSSKAGELYSGTNKDYDNVFTCESECAGIGGDCGHAAGTIEINSGVVYARGYKDDNGTSGGAGIGGGIGGNGGTITIRGGRVDATGGNYSAGIGGGSSGNGGTITISGGKVKAKKGLDAVGIGPGAGAYNATVVLTYGDVYTAMWVESDSYGGEVTLKKGFASGVDQTEYFLAGTYTESSSSPEWKITRLFGKTLTPEADINQVRVGHVENAEITIENPGGVVKIGEKVALRVVPREDDDYLYQKYSLVYEYENKDGNQVVEPDQDPNDQYRYTFIMPKAYSGVTIRAIYVSDWGRLYHQIEDGVLTNIKLEKDILWRGPSANGKYGGDPSPLTVSGSLTLDLNGHTIDRGATDPVDGAKVFSVVNYGSLILKDSSVGQTGKVTGGNPLNSEGGGVTVNGGCEFTLEGGSITRNKAPLGGGVYVQAEGTFTMKGGRIEHNVAFGEEGEHGKGGGVYNDGDFILTDGAISHNQADACGGGVYSGGGIYEKGSFTMSGGVIDNNTAETNGGGVYNNIDTTFALSGGAIRSNNCIDGHGSQVFNEGLSSVTAENGADEAGNLSDDLEEKHVHTAPIFKLSGAPVISGEVYLCQGDVITVAGELEYETPITIGLATMGVFTNDFIERHPNDPPYRFFTTVRGDGYAISWSGDGEEAMEDTEWKALQGALDWTPIPIALSHYAGADEKILAHHTRPSPNPSSDDVSLEVKSGREVTLDLEGCVISMNFFSDDDSVGNCSVFTVEGTLTVKDSDGKGKGRISGSKTDEGGGVHVVRHGKFTLESGEISGNKASKGGGVYVEGHGTFQMNGGRITDKESQTGGGVWVGGIFNLDGGSVASNQAVNGAGVHIQGGDNLRSTFWMNDGTIEKNEASHGGGGVSVWLNSVFRMSGMNPGLVPTSLWGPGSPPDSTGEPLGSTA